MTARAAAVHDVILGFQDGYQTLVGERGVTLSGGQKQRVTIARTILKDPCILILDDSTSSVDTETEVEIREALQNLMQNRTTFIIAHRIQSVANADLILVMEPAHKARIVSMSPELTGKLMLFDQWSGATGIQDPYRRSREFHEQTYLKLEAAAGSWAEKLVPGVSRT
mgnify:CR=1 FL=1